MAYDAPAQSAADQVLKSCSTHSKQVAVALLAQWCSEGISTLSMNI